MEKFVINGGKPLSGNVQISGAKNVALKIFVASLLTEEELVIHNVPHIRDLFLLLEVLELLGARVVVNEHTVRIRSNAITKTQVPLEIGARLRTSSLVLGPLLARFGEATVPNPGGCRIGTRPIDRHIEAFRQMGATIEYHSEDGYFYAHAKALHGTTVTFPKNTHTGTEAIILAAVLAKGTTELKNAAEEVEVDDLIACLNSMGAKITRPASRTIVIEGVEKLRGTEYSIMPDRNEEVTFAIAAAITGGDILVHGSQPNNLKAFFDVFKKAGAQVVSEDTNVTRYKGGSRLVATDVVTEPHPGFMTDWQAPWAVLMTQAKGKSTIHETVFESRFSYVKQLNKMGANIVFFDPKVSDPAQFYNFNWQDRVEGYHQAILITGPTKLHNAILEMDDLRAGATLVLAALTAEGESSILRVEQIDRGYEKIEERLRMLGADIIRVREDFA